jgi:hypothetical protein
LKLLLHQDLQQVLLEYENSLVLAQEGWR